MDTFFTKRPNGGDIAKKRCPSPLSMKIIKIIFFSLLALSLIVCASVFIFFETFDTDQYLSQITKKVSLALGRQVSIGGVGLGFSEQGITLDAWPLTIADDRAFTTQPFIKVDRVRVSLDVRSLILQREIHITDILLQSPQIHFIRSQEGNFNARSILQEGQFVYRHPDPSVILSAAKDLNKINSLKDSSPLGLRMTKEVLHNSPFKEYAVFSAINIKSIKIQDASISFIDQSQGMPLDIWLLNINASLNDFSLSFNASPLVFKGISQGDPDSPIFKNIAGVVQLNMGHPQGDIIITGGVIKNFNIIKTLVETQNFASLPMGFGNMEGFIDKLGAEDTVIEKAEAKFSFHDKTVFIDDSLIKTNIFELKAQGSVDQGLNMDMQTMLRLNEDVSAALVNELEGLKFLCDDSKRIAIGASLKGVMPHLKYKPNKDFRKKSKKALIEEGGNFLKNFLK